MFLKDGSEIHDPRIDRVVRFDERSRGFSILQDISVVRPKTKTWKNTKVLDQGKEGACVGFGCCHALLAEPNVTTEVIGNRYAKELIYWEAQKIDQWPGGSYPGATPQYSGTSVLAGLKVLKNKGFISEYKWSFSLNELIVGVSSHGPAILGLPWYDTMYEPGFDHFITIKNGRKVGGHCILCIGVDIEGKFFTLLNSWGVFWGKRGKCYITFSEMEFLLKDRGEAAFITKKEIKNG